MLVTAPGVDKKGNWHIINHAYDVKDQTHCGNSTLSAHVFSGNLHLILTQS